MADASAPTSPTSVMPADERGAFDCFQPFLASIFGPDEREADGAEGAEPGATAHDAHGVKFAVTPDPHWRRRDSYNAVDPESPDNIMAAFPAGPVDHLSVGEAPAAAPAPPLSSGSREFTVT